MSDNKKYTRLTFTQRLQIQNCLNEGASFSSIARLIVVSTTTVSREVKAHRIEDNHVTRFHHNSCVNRKECKRRSLCAGMEKICRKRIVFVPTVLLTTAIHPVLTIRKRFVPSLTNLHMYAIIVLN